jgi:hypothetical protein
MQNSSYLYSLRFAVEPGHHEAERLDVLVDFCKTAWIDDVMFFINCEELNQGHLTLEETKPWLELILRGKEQLEPLGIVTSINPWPSLLHGDRGRSLKKGQNFRLMVDPYGNRSSAVACPLCREWRRYISEIYALYASINPNMLWVEDDFRLHNHGPLIWGGCFCELHMEEYSRRAGKKLTRHEFAEGIIKTGEPHPYRKIWLDTARDTMVENAALIGEAVHKVSPATRVGLMSSNPPTHCAEGRDWEGILKGLAGNTPMVNRPHLPAYNEVHPQGYLRDFNAISRLTCSMIPESTEVYPELESFPHTRFSKSKTLTEFQLVTSLLLGADGITLNIFDMMGNGILLQEGYQEVLSRVKDFLSGVGKLGLKTGKPEGIKVPVHPGSSYTLHTSCGESMEELYPKENFWASYLSCMGIANTYSLEKTFKKEIVAISGQYFRNLNKQELEDLFTDNFVIMEGEAAYTLFTMGQGELAGMTDVRWHEMDSGFQAYEQVCNGKTYCGIKEARLSSQAVTGDFLEIRYDREAYSITNVINPYGMTVAAGMTLWENRVLILPYGHFDKGYQTHLNPLRQGILQDVLLNAEAGECPCFVWGNPYITVNPYRMGGRKILMVCNWSTDEIDEVKIYAPTVDIAGVEELCRNGSEFSSPNLERDGCFVLLKDGLGAMQLRVLVFAIQN